MSRVGNSSIARACEFSSAGQGFPTGSGLCHYNVTTVYAHSAMNHQEVLSALSLLKILCCIMCEQVPLYA